MSRKKRLLFLTEASFLPTGYGTVALEVLRRLQASGKYECAELAGHGAPGDPRSLGLPWVYYPVVPPADRPDLQEIYHSDPANTFGQWVFEEACLAFRPDVVCSFRDPFMDSFVQYSPFRPYFRWVEHAPVDASPLDEPWVAAYCNCDGVMTYTDWGTEVLRRESRGLVNTLGAAPLGVDFDAFRPVANKNAHRQALNVKENILLIGYLFRNQARKLLPDLVLGFAQLLREAPEDIAGRVYLYLHTAWPDLGWNIPRLLKDAGVASRVILTYHCQGCGHFFPSFFCDTRASCRKCGNFSAVLPQSTLGVPRKALADIYNLMDVYVQYVNAGGFEMPLAEAAACGVPVLATGWGATAELARKLGGRPVKMQRLVKEAQTHRDMPYPDNDDLVRGLVEVLSLPDSLRRKRGFEGALRCRANYSWDELALRWDEVLSRLPPARGWGESYEGFRPVLPPEGLSWDDFVCWGLAQTAGRADLIHSHLHLQMVRDLGWGMTITGGANYLSDLCAAGALPKTRKFGREEALTLFRQLGERKVVWEQRRAEVVRAGGRP